MELYGVVGLTFDTKKKPHRVGPSRPPLAVGELLDADPGSSPSIGMPLLCDRHGSTGSTSWKRTDFSKARVEWTRIVDIYELIRSPLGCILILRYCVPLHPVSKLTGKLLLPILEPGPILLLSPASNPVRTTGAAANCPD